MLLWLTEQTWTILTKLETHALPLILKNEQRLTGNFKHDFDAIKYKCKISRHKFFIWSYVIRLACNVNVMWFKYKPLYTYTNLLWRNKLRRPYQK